MQPLLFLLVFGQICFSASQNPVYHFINESMSWDKAQTYCRKYYTDLATVRNMKELERLTAAADGRTDAWIGLHQTSGDPKERKWHWSQPEVKYNETEVKWNQGKAIEPTDTGQGQKRENCVIIDKERDWIDTNCVATETCFICYNETSNTLSYQDEKKNWLEAQKYCRARHTDLISGTAQLNMINTSKLHENNCENNNAVAEWWIGLFRDTWGWSDGNDSSVRIWDEWEEVLEKDPSENNKKCAKIQDGKMKLESCDSGNGGGNGNGNGGGSSGNGNGGGSGNGNGNGNGGSGNGGSGNGNGGSGNGNGGSNGNGGNGNGNGGSGNGGSGNGGSGNGNGGSGNGGSGNGGSGNGNGGSNGNGGNGNGGSGNGGSGNGGNGGGSDDNHFICYDGQSQNLTYHFINIQKTWDEARSYCRQNYKDLATVRNMTELERLIAAADGRTDAWIGLYQTNHSLKARKWHWSQPEVKYNEGEAKWKQDVPNEPTDTGQDLSEGKKRENCVVINDQSKWIDTNCQTPHSCFICYNESSNTPVLIGGSENKTWLAAQQFCRTHHTDLMSGLDQQRQTEVKYPTRSTWCWIGLSRDTWGWSDGSNSSFRNFKTNVNEWPNKCATLSAQGRWESADCHHNKSFICHDDLFILVKEKKTWEEALIYCRTQHRDLAWFIDKTHLKKMAMERAKMADNGTVWVGLHYICFLEAWAWVNGHYVSDMDENWEDHGGNKCSVGGAMQGDKWVKRDLGEKYNFICVTKRK